MSGGRMRWTPAVLVGVLVASMVYGALALTGTGFGGGVPDEVTVGGVRAGDHGRYDYALTTAGTGFGEILPAVPWLTFRVEEAISVQDSDGTERLRVPWHLQDGGYMETSERFQTYRWGLQEGHVQYLAEGARIAADAFTVPPGYTVEDAVPTSYPNFYTSNIPEGVFIGVQTDASTQARVLAYGSGPTSCLQALRPGTWAVQGMAPYFDCSLQAPVLAVSLGEPVEKKPYPERNTVVRLGPQQDGFRPIGVDTVAGRESVVVEDGPVRVWLSDGLPVPLQVTVEEQGRLHVFRLTEFERGDGPPAEAEPWSDPVGLEREPTQRFGMDEAGVDHVYPPSAALEDAADDVAVAAFLASHPDAKVSALEGRLVAEDRLWAQTSIQWIMRVSDGQAGLEVTVTVPLDQNREPRRILAEVESVAAPAREPMRDLPSVATLRAESPAVEEGIALWGLSNGTTDEAWYVSIRHGSQVEEGGAVGSEVLENGVSVRDAKVAMRWTVLSSQSTQPGVWQGGEEGGSPEEESVAIQWIEPKEALWPAAGIATLIGFLTILLLKTPFAGFFSRIHGSSVTDNPIRSILLERIRSDPGIHLGEAARQSGIGHRSLLHHIDKLVEAGLVRRQESQGYVCLFPVGTEPSLVAGAGSLRSATARALFDQVRERPGITLSEVAAAVGVSNSTAHHHIERMREGGFLQTVRDGRSKRLFAVK